MEKIDFLGIGVQKSASSWLWTNLKAHPDIWLPPRKELHYFDRSLKYPSPSYLATDNVLTRLLSGKKHNILYRKKLFEELYQAYKERDNQKFVWLSKYYLKNCNDQWYTALFRYGNGYVKGEITPAYSILNIEDIRHIKQLFPDVKILLTLRNPIERAWSQVKFYVTRNIHGISPKDEQKLIEFLQSPMQVMRNDYVAIVQKWQTVFGENLYISYYDDIINDPEAYLRKIYRFLNISSKYGVFIKNRINPSKEIEMPHNIEMFLRKMYHTEIQNLYKQLQNEHIRTWIS